MNYLPYWGLKEKPFARSDGDCFFAAAPQREAIAGLSYFASSRFAAAFLVAPRRCGASWLMRHIQQMHGLGDCATELVATNGSHRNCGEVLISLGQALGLRLEDGKAVPIEVIDGAIEACRRDGVRLIWMVDRLDACSINTAGNLTSMHPNFSIVMAMTPQEHRQHAAALRSCAVQVELQPLTLDDTGDFLRHGLRYCGCERPLFVDGAIVRLHELTRGCIADLSAAAELSLAIAAQYQMDAVAPAAVEAAFEIQSQAA